MTIARRRDHNPAGLLVLGFVLSASAAHAAHPLITEHTERACDTGSGEAL
jgi:hypothetical protein